MSSSLGWCWQASAGPSRLCLPTCPQGSHKCNAALHAAITCDDNLFRALCTRCSQTMVSSPHGHTCTISPKCRCWSCSPVASRWSASRLAVRRAHRSEATSQGTRGATHMYSMFIDAPRSSANEGRRASVAQRPLHGGPPAKTPAGTQPRIGHDCDRQARTHGMPRGERSHAASGRGPSPKPSRGQTSARCAPGGQRHPGPPSLMVLRDFEMPLHCPSTMAPLRHRAPTERSPVGPLPARQASRRNAPAHLMAHEAQAARQRGQHRSCFRQWSTSSQGSSFLPVAGHENLLGTRMHALLMLTIT